MARRLPGECLGVVETRLARGSATVDLSIRLTEPPAPPLLAAGFLPPHLRAFLADGWRRIGYPRPVPSIWLEFDLDRADREVPSPVVCARLGDRAEVGWLVDDLLPALHGRELTAEQRALVRRAVAAIPAGGSLMYAFSLRPRQRDTVRLELLGLAPDAMAEYLGRLGLADESRRIADLAPLAAGSDRFHLSFDVADRIGPRLGLEYAHTRLPQQEPRWAELLDRLAAAGLCAAEKRDAVLAWPGYDSLWTAARRWPPEAVRRGGYCVRCLSHLKLVSRPDREPEAKAYLIFQHVAKKRAAADF